MADEEQEVYYRYDDPWDEDSPIYLGEYRVRRRTAKGVWLVIVKHDPRHDKFVLNGEDGKRYAYPTVQGARRSYLKRKERAVSLTAANLQRQEAYLKRVEAGEWDAPPTAQESFLF